MARAWADARLLGSRKGQHVGRLVLAAPGAVERAGYGRRRSASTLDLACRPVALIGRRRSAASAASAPAASASARRSQSPASIMMSSSITACGPDILPRRFRRRLARRLVVGADDAAHQVVAHHVLLLEGDAGDALDALQDAHRLDQARFLARRQVDLASGRRSPSSCEPSPRRVRNIFICIGVVFCASSRMTKALASVRPRMKASGAISITPVCDAALAPARPAACRRARRRAAADRDRPSPSCRRAGSRAARRPRPPGATGSIRSTWPLLEHATPHGRRRDRSCRCRPGRGRRRARCCCSAWM